MKNKELEKQHFAIRESFDKLYYTSLEVTEAFNCKYIPLNTLFELVKASKMKKSKELGEFPKVYNATLDLLYKVSMDYCTANKLDNKLPMIVLKSFIQSLKDGLK